MLVGLLVRCDATRVRVRRQGVLVLTCWASANEYEGWYRKLRSKVETVGSLVLTAQHGQLADFRDSGQWRRKNKQGAMTWFFRFRFTNLTYHTRITSSVHHVELGPVSIGRQHVDLGVKDMKADISIIFVDSAAFHRSSCRSLLWVQLHHASSDQRRGAAILANMIPRQV